MVQRSLADWPVVLAAASLLLSSATVLAASAIYADSVALGSLHRAVLAAPAADRNIVVTTYLTPPDFAGIDGVVTREIADAVAPAAIAVSHVVRTGWLTQHEPQEGRKPLSGLSAYERIDAHADLVAGRWPEPHRQPLEASLPAAVARAAGVSTGDRILMADSRDPSSRLELIVTGTWRPHAGDPYWLGARGDESAGDSPAGLLVVATEDLLASSSQLDAEWRAVPAVETLTVGGVDDVRTGVRTLQQRMKPLLPGGREVGVRTGLADILGGVERSVLVARAGILLLIVQFAVLAGYAVLLVAGILLERRRSETALLRARGGGSRHIAGMALAEAALLAVPVALVAPALGLGVVRTLGSLGPLAEAGLIDSVALSCGPVVMSGIAAAACATGLAVPALLSDANLAGVRAALSRQARHTLAQRVGLDLALLAIAVIGLWQLRLYGAPLTRNARGVLGIDPLLVVAPAIALVAGAVLTIRFLPRVAELAENLAPRRRALVDALGVRQVARRPLRYTRSALLLMLAVALGTFSALYTVSWQQSQADQAAHRAVSDVRMVVSGYADMREWAVGPSLRSIAGVTGATPVVRESLRFGRTVRDGELLALDPIAVQRVTRLARGADGPALQAELAKLPANRPVLAAVELPGAPTRLGVVIDAAIRDVFQEPGIPLTPASWRGIGVRALIQDGEGSIRRLEGGEARFGTTGDRVTIPLTAELDGKTISVTPPARVLGIELVVRPPEGAIVGGAIDIRGFQVSENAAGEAWTSVPLEPAVEAWRWERIGFGGRVPYRSPPDQSTRVVFGDSRISPPMFGGGETLRLFSGGEVDDLAAVAGSRFLELTGARVGDTVATTVFGTPLQLRIVGTTQLVRPLDPDAPFVVVDRPALEAATFAATAEPLAPREWWLKVEEGRERAVVEAVRAPRFGATEVIGRTELTEALLKDPVALGVVGALTLGAVAALVFAAIGFVVSATISMNERIPEFTILRALGLSGRQLGTWLTLENGFLLAFAIVSGCAVGLLLAWLVLPFATFTPDGRPPVPAADLVIPWSTLLPFYALAGALLIPTVLVIRRQLPSVRISDVLRGRDE